MTSFRAALSCPSAYPMVIVFGAIVSFAPTAQINPATNISNATRQERTAITLRDKTIRCPLREGETTFIVSSPRNSSLDRVVLVNENLSARGELRIAISNDKLCALSNKWIPVDGSIHFRRKRLFNLSLVGVEARYVKLTFRVEREQARATNCSPLSKVATQLFAF